MRSDKSKETGYSADVTRKKASDQADAPFAEPYVRRAGLRDIPQLYRLWQGCFGDSDSFTDYYFDTYFPENEVWVVEKKGRITAQLHENLYELKAGIRRIPGVYIVGVSTDKSQRHQGQMSALLARVFREQREKKLPFLYLMPADEAIYLPSQFAYIYAQHVFETRAAAEENEADPCGFRGCSSDIRVRPASCDEDLTYAVDAAAKALADMDICTQRDPHYFYRLQLENRADGGDLMIFEKDGRRIGYLSYACEDKAEIRDFAAREEEAEKIWQLTLQYFSEKDMSILTFPSQEEALKRAASRIGSELVQRDRPIIMGRLIDAGAFLELIGGSCRDSRQLQLSLDIRDRWIPENDGIWLWTFGGGSSCAWYLGKRKGSFTSASLSGVDMSVDAGALMQWLTGYRSLEELKEHGLLSWDGASYENIKKAPILNRIFINEII